MRQLYVADEVQNNDSVCGKLYDFIVEFLLQIHENVILEI
jgi:hypothetical protein